jgi:site-specific recombinase XerD
MKQPSWPDVTGPLESYAAGHRKELTRLGYSPWTASAHMHLAADVSRWLGERELAPADFSSVRVKQFLADRRADGHVRLLSPRGLIPLLGYLQGLGVLAEEPAPEPDDPAGRLLKEFVDHLRNERGLAPRTIVGYHRVAKLFLTKCAPDPTIEGCGVEVLGSAAINAFLLGECARRSVGSANNMVTALRALMRFFYLHGDSATSMADCVPHGAAWRDSGRSRALDPGEVRCLLDSCDRRTAAGRRDFAILTVLARLGLRANEVVCLTLEDLDWRAGEMVVCGKGGRRDRLPVPVDVGRAVADYCRRGRPRNDHRALFLHARAPYGPLSSGAVTHVVMQACRRAGLAPVGAHRLRHTSASAMRRSGVPLLEIGQVLRHRWVVSTALYAKDDLDALATIARPWPGGRS